jgi:ferredoxin
MAYVITEACVGVKDKACIEACPVDCIHDTENSPQMYINPNECITCGGCVFECPVEAIYDESDVPDKWRHSIELNAAFFN